MKKLATILLATVFVSGAALSSAAYSAYMTVTGARQGAFKGSGRSKVNKIPILQFTMSDQKAANSRNVPMELDIEIDAVDVVQFQTAFANNENLTVTIQVVQSMLGGKEKDLETIKLTNASIRTLAQSFKNGTEPTETMHLTAQRVEVTQSSGTVHAADDWTSKV